MLASAGADIVPHQTSAVTFCCGKRRSHVRLEEVDQQRLGPVDAGVARLVLGVDGPDGDADLAVLLHELGEIEGVGLLRLRVALHVRAAVLHPAGRDPGAGPEVEVGPDLQGGLDEGDQLLLIARNRELGHRVVAGRVVERVPAHRVVAGPDRHPAVDELRARLRVEEELHRAGHLIGGENRERVPSHLVEGSAEPVKPLVLGVLIDDQPGRSTGHLGDLPRHPVGARGRRS